MLGTVSSLAAAATLRSGLIAGTEPPADDVATDDGIATSIGDVITTMWGNLNDNLYQTGVALIAATIAVVVMRNQKVPPAILVPVTIGAFWVGWLGYNTVTAESNPLFPGELDATDIWDVAFTGETGFFIAVIAACIAAIFLWRSQQSIGARIVLIAGAVAGASFVYNLVQAVRIEAA